MQVAYPSSQDLFIHPFWINTSTEASSREQEINCRFTGKETHLLGLCDLIMYQSNEKHLSAQALLEYAVSCRSLLGFVTQDGTITSSPSQRCIYLSEDVNFHKTSLAMSV